MRKPKRPLSGAVFVVWLAWAGALALHGGATKLQRAFCPARPTHQPRILRVSRLGRVLLGLGGLAFRAARGLAGLVSACPVCFVPEPCAEHHCALNPELRLTGSQRRAIRRARRAAGLTVGLVLALGLSFALGLTAGPRLARASELRLYSVAQWEEALPRFAPASPFSNPKGRKPMPQDFTLPVAQAPHSAQPATVGRIVWYWPLVLSVGGARPFAAIVTGGDGQTIDLVVFGHPAKPDGQERTDVRYGGELGGDNLPTAPRPCWTWPPKVPR